MTDELAATAAPEFDTFAEAYDRALAEGISVSGEDKTYFARGRLAWLGRRLQTMNFAARSVLDFGCGTGSSTPYFHECLVAESILGIDVSAASLRIARRDHGSATTQFAMVDEHRPAGNIDLAFCNGVFHHIPPAERLSAVEHVFDSLRPGGLFAYWENNSWNPATRYVMSRIPFDRDAITLTPPESRRLLRSGGFEVLETRYHFIFPRALRWLRPLEPVVSRWPLGTQYVVLCRRPAS